VRRKMSRQEKWGCMYDCIHLKACRRVQRIGKILRLNVPRYCSEECSAYVRGGTTKFVPLEDVESMIDKIMDYVRDGVESIRDGYDQYDVYCMSDLWGYMPKGKSLDEIIEEQYNEECEL
jgi:hypothetical protein